MDENKKVLLETKWKKVVALALTNDDFKQKLVNDPISILSEHGLTIPFGTQARVDIEKEVSLLLPPNVSQEVAQEVKWWKWGLEMIREFGKEDLKKAPPNNIPEGDDDV